MSLSSATFSPAARQGSARRAGLLAASALCGVAAMLAHPSLAGTLPGIPGAGNITVSPGGAQPLITFPDAITLQIDLNAPRTVINWSSLHVSSGDAMNFLFDSASDIVLNKTTSQIAIDNGAVITGKVGAATGGNVWFYSPQGVIVSPGATMTAGSFVFAGGTGLNDATFVNAADPTAVLRAASNGLIRVTTVSSATSASVNADGDVVLSASSGALNIATAYGKTASVSTTSGSITASEVTATQGAATVTAGGPGATVTQITGATGVTVSSGVNSSVGAATTTTSGDILIASNGSASLTLGNSARDLTLSAPQVFVSTVDAVRSVYVTGTTGATVTNRIFAGDDIEVTADGAVAAGGAYMKTTGAGGIDDAHILLRSTTGSVAGGTLLTQGTGVKAGDITVSGATSASLTTGVSTRDIRISGASVSVTNASAARDVLLTAANGSATIVTEVTAGDDIEVTAAGGDVLAGGATLKSTGAGAADDAHVLARSTTGAASVGSAITLGTGATAGDVTIQAATTATLGSAASTRDLIWRAANGLDLTGNYGADREASLVSTSGAINQTGGVVTAQRLIGSSVGGANFGAANRVAQLGDFTNTGGLFKLVNDDALTIDGTVRSTGTIALTSHGGMSFTAAGTVRADSAGDAVILASDGVFTNGRGADAVTASNAAGRWLIYTQAMGSPTGSTAGNNFNGLAGKSFYGSAYDFLAETFAATPNAGDRFVYGYQPTLTVAPDSQVMTYNGGVPATSATITGLINGDAAADAWSGTPTISGATSKNVGTYVLTAAGNLSSDLNYAFSYGTGSLRIDAKTITGVLSADDKTYDRTTNATGSIGLSGVLTGEDVSASGAYAFSDRNAGTGKMVTASGVALSGADAGNYVLSPVTSAQADIFKKAVTGALSASNKTYDGATTATGSIGLTGVIAGDVVSASGTYRFADANVGAGKAVTASGVVLAGLDAGNYELGAVGGALADILRRQVTVSADDRFKTSGQVDPILTYRITAGGLVAGDDFTGGLTRAAGEVPGGYDITRGSLGASSNYEVIFIGAMFTINPLPMKEQDGSAILRSLIQSPDFTLDWDPEANLQTKGLICPDDGCAPQAALARNGVRR